MSTAADTIKSARERAGLSQAELARRAGTSQPAIARLESGAVSPTVETLERVLAAAGTTLELSFTPAPTPDPVIEAYKRDIDRTLLRANLRRSVEERLQGLAALDALGDELRRAARAPRKAAQR